jgi:hypothetical protein
MDTIHKTVEIPMMGATIAIKGKCYEVLETVTKQVARGQFTTFATLVEIDDEGDETDIVLESVNLDMVDYTVPE